MKRFFTILSLCLIAIYLSSGNTAAQDQCPQSLIHFWKFDTRSHSKIVDRIGNLDGEFQSPPEYVPGKVDSAAYFDGNKQVTLPANQDFNWGKDASFTIEFWVRKTNACPNRNNSSNNVIIGRDDNVTQVHWWAGISCTNPGRVNFTLISNDGTNQTLESKKGVINGLWHLIGIVRNGTAKTTSIFIDGQLDTTATYTFTDDFASIAPIGIGWLSAGQQYHFEGYLDELALYNTAIDTSLFRAHFNNGAGKAYCQVAPEPATGPYALTVNFTGMTSVIDKPFSMYVINHNSKERLDSATLTFDTGNFSVRFDSILAGTAYDFDFWSDKNANGKYNAPPVDESWRVENIKLNSDSAINFAYSTNYTRIFDVQPEVDSTHFSLALDFIGFNQEVDRNMTVYIRQQQNDSIVDSLYLSPVDSGDFTVAFDSLTVGERYNLDYYSDVNNDSMYSAPPVDHAWRKELPVITKDTVMNVSYNTEYTDIFPVSGGDSAVSITINFTGFTPETGKNLVLYLRDKETGDFLDSLRLTPVDTADFTLVLDSLQKDKDYHIDYYIDFNGDNVYQVPPTDHSWRIVVNNLNADTTINVAHDTNYVDIGLVVTGVPPVENESGFMIYPNPVKDYLTVYYIEKVNSLRIYNLTGSLVINRNVAGSGRSERIDVSALKPGMYILQLRTSSGNHEMKLMKE
ncbi:MAG TPA: LamG-like jellyroll fold domain-containing protein [Bacteroidales bacterium]|nr:LamG-like jellyroll fold domain-containing protein [Bacteroidales bacterium]